MSHEDQVLGVAYGLGVDSTAVLVGMVHLRIVPDFILFADVGGEKQATYDYLPVIQAYLEANNMPQVQTVKYTPKRSPYTTIEGNMVMNATLPGATFGRASCTMKWKIEPQNKWTNNDTLCKLAWYKGQKVLKAIGFEDGEQYRKLRAADKVHGGGDKKFDYWYPLQDWGWDRDECKRQIAQEGLPVPPKSACIFCPNTKPCELDDLTPLERTRIMRVEITAEPFNRKVEGLWRRTRKRDGRPGSMTEYILDQGLEYAPLSELEPMPLNPACAKSDRGFTFMGPHKEYTLAELVEADQDRKDQVTEDQVTEDEDNFHRQLLLDL